MCVFLYLFLDANLLHHQLYCLPFPVKVKVKVAIVMSFHDLFFLCQDRVESRLLDGRSNSLQICAFVFVFLSTASMIATLVSGVIRFLLDAIS